MATPRKVVILGATGSIGTSALKILRQYPEDLQLVGIAANQRFPELAAIATEFQVPACVIFEETAFQAARQSGLFPTETRLSCGPEGLLELVAAPDLDIVLAAMVGTAALFPALAAIEGGKTIALANKEILVMAGEFITRKAQESGSLLLPTDSEHNAIFQCLEGARQDFSEVEKLILTASGGPFRNSSLEAMQAVRLADALKHPNWDMGPKVTLDSATMANKGLELIEARWLFGVPAGQLDVVVHPQSIVHSMVQYVDGSILAQLSPPSMTFSIQHCLLYPERKPGVEATLDFREALQLDFEPPDLSRFASLRLAMESLETGGTAPCVFNAANEVAVHAFTQEKIGFLQIPWVIDKTLEKTNISEPSSLDVVLESDREARAIADRFIDSL